MEKLLTKKVGVWVLLLLMVFVLIGVVGFGMLVRNRAQGHDRFGLAGEIAYNIASIPVTLRDMAEGDNRMIARVHTGEMRHTDRMGWTVYGPSGESGVDGYLLLSRHDPGAKAHVVEMVDLSSLEIAHTWRPDPEALFEGLQFEKEYENRPFKTEAFRIIHPYLLEDGGLLVKDMYSPLARIDACGEKVWAMAGAYHHTTERGADGTFWIPGERELSELENISSRYHNDSLSQITADGDEIYSASLTQILIENGYEFLLTGMNAGASDDPLHLNDIQPVLEDGAFWKKGDLLLSIRHKSAIALFRPSTGKILWIKYGPWSFQHDVDILSDGKIAVFDNKMYSRWNGPSVDPVNDVAIYDFATDDVSSPYLNAMIEQDVRTVSEGLQTILPDGHLMVEETNFGRILFFSPSGELVLDYVNGGDDGNPYVLGWVRWVSREEGEVALQNIANVTCTDG